MIGRVDVLGWLWVYRYLVSAAVFALAALAGLISARKDKPRGRQRRVLAVVFGSVTAAGFLVLQFAGQDVWIWLLAFIPTALVLYQGIYIAIFKNKQFFEDGSTAPHRTDTPSFLLPLINAASVEERRYYGTASLALRFALPALLLQAVALTMGYALVRTAGSAVLVLDAMVLQGARLGLVGAYVSVVLYLGNRTFRSDVTTGAAFWSSVTLAVGPVFAGVLVLLTDPKSVADARWTAQIIPFAAGFSLRYVAGVVEAAIRRVMGGAAIDTSRSLPLTQLRGVSRDVEARLAEEGIENVAELAMANPYRLRRNTSYDKRQLVAWIDQALLMTYLPLAWQTLEAEGITGAIDLVWYVSLVWASPDDPSAPQGAVPPTLQTPPPQVDTLAKRNKLDPASLWEAILRLHSDSQVRMTWALYQLDDSEHATDDQLAFALKQQAS